LGAVGVFHPQQLTQQPMLDAGRAAARWMTSDAALAWDMAHRLGSARSGADIFRTTGGYTTAFSLNAGMGALKMGVGGGLPGLALDTAFQAALAHVPGSQDNPGFDLGGIHGGRTPGVALALFLPVPSGAVGGTGGAVSEAAPGAGSGLRALVSRMNPQGFENNCGSVAISLDRTLAGAPASAIDTGPLFMGEVAEVYGNRGFASYPSLNSITEFMGRAGPGSRGIVYGGRAGGEMGHYFNVVNQNGRVIYIDATEGAFADPTGFSFFNMMRTF
jgi:hypothetical protein